MLLARFSAQFSLLPATLERLYQKLLSLDDPAALLADSERRVFSAALHSHTMCGVLPGHDFATTGPERDVR